MEHKHPTRTSHYDRILFCRKPTGIEMSCLFFEKKIKFVINRCNLFNEIIKSNCMKKKIYDNIIWGSKGLRIIKLFSESLQYFYKSTFRLNKSCNKWKRLILYHNRNCLFKLKLLISDMF